MINNLKIGDELFKYVEFGGIFRYIVIGVRNYEDGNQLEVECKNCTHGWMCRVLVAQNDHGNLIAVHMLNDEENESQKHWQSQCNGLHFWRTVNEAKKERLLQIKINAVESVKKSKDNLLVAENRLKEINEAIDLISTNGEQP